MRTLLINVLLWALLAAPVVHPDAATVNNTDPGCDAGELSCAISAAINEALRNSNPTDALAVNGQRARGCANFGGRWEASMSGGVRCSVAPSVNQPFSFIGPLDVAQNGCRFSYFDFGGLQRGTIRGRTIRIPKPKIPRGTVFRSGRITGKGRGTIQNQDRARVKISALFKGKINGIRTDCTIKWTTNFVRLPPIVPTPPPPPPIPPTLPPVGFLDTTVSANYEWPNLGTVLYASGNAVFRSFGTEYTNIGGQGIVVDVREFSFRITYLNGWSLATGPKTFDGLVISVLSGTTQRITGVSLGSTNIAGYDGTQLSFDANHVFVNQLGFLSFPSGSFIDVNVTFGN